MADDKTFAITVPIKILAVEHVIDNPQERARLTEQAALEEALARMPDLDVRARFRSLLRELGYHS